MVLLTGAPLGVQEREMEMRRLALDEERRRREELEKRLQEETTRRQRLIEREVKLREKQRSQVPFILSSNKNHLNLAIKCKCMLLKWFGLC